MLKQLTLAVTAAFCTVAMSAETAPAAQTLPQQGYVTIASGDYTVTFMPKSNYRISGFAYQNKELFISRGAPSGTNIVPAAAEKLISAKLTVDDQVPAKVTYAFVKGNKVVLERDALFGDVKLSVKYTLTPAGLTWSCKYKLETSAKKPSYFYLNTMTWSNKFDEYFFSSKNTPGINANSTPCVQFQFPINPVKYSEVNPLTANNNAVAPAIHGKSRSNSGFSTAPTVGASTQNTVRPAVVIFIFPAIKCPAATAVNNNCAAPKICQLRSR